MLTTLNSPEADAFRQELRTWLESAIPDDWKPGEMTYQQETELRREWGHRLWEGGYAGLSWPTEYGGRGFGPIEEFIFFEEGATAGDPDTLDIIGKYLAGPAIIEFGSEEQKERFLRPILAGDEIWCEGFSERDAGSDMANVQTFAAREGSQYRISGRKLWTSYATFAQRCYLLARTSRDAGRHSALSIFLLDMDQASIEIRPIKQITGATASNELVFDGAVATVEERLGPEGDGWKLAGIRGPLRKIRLLRDGLSRYSRVYRLNESYVRCATECSRNGDQHPDPDAFRTILAIWRWHMTRLAELQANDREWYPTASILRFTGVEVLQAVCAAGLKLGCPEHEEFWRDQYLETRSASIAGGTSEIQRNVIARAVLSMPRPNAYRTA